MALCHERYSARLAMAVGRVPLADGGDSGGLGRNEIQLAYSCPLWEGENGGLAMA